MEGGNKNKISLEASLDTHSSDMLVPVGEPTFLHNRQKFQGKYLPTSLRYEHDGWAAGWDVYEFKFNSVEIELTDTIIAKRYTLNSDTSQYIISFEEKGTGKILGQVFWTNSPRYASRIGSSLAGLPTVSKVDGKTLVAGLFDGKAYLISIDMVSQSATVISGSADFMAGITVSNSGLVLLKVDYHSKAVSVNITDLVLGTDLNTTAGDLFATYGSYEAGAHSWSTVENSVSYVPSSDTLIVNDTACAHTVSGNLISFDYLKDWSITNKINVSSTFSYKVLKNWSHKLSINTVVAGADDGIPFNIMRLTKLSEHSFLYADNNLMYQLQLPFWLGITVHGKLTEGLVEQPYLIYDDRRVEDWYDDDGDRVEARCFISASDSTYKRYDQIIIDPEVNFWIHTYKIPTVYQSISSDYNGKVRYSVEVEYCNFCATDSDGTIHRAYYKPSYTPPPLTGGTSYSAGFYIDDDYTHGKVTASVHTHTFTGSVPAQVTNIGANVDLSSTLNIDISYLDPSSIWVPVEPGTYRVVSKSFKNDDKPIKYTFLTDSEFFNYTVPQVSVTYDGSTFTLDTIPQCINPDLNEYVLKSYENRHDDYCCKAWVLKSFMQYTVTMQDKLTQDNLNDNLTISLSPDADLNDANAIMIDRNTTAHSKKLYDISTSSAILSNDSLSLMLNPSPAEPNYVFYSKANLSDAPDFYMPGHIYWGTLDEVLSNDGNLYCNEVATGDKDITIQHGATGVKRYELSSVDFTWADFEKTHAFTKKLGELASSDFTLTSDSITEAVDTDGAYSGTQKATIALDGFVSLDATFDMATNLIDVLPTVTPIEGVTATVTPAIIIGKNSDFIISAQLDFHVSGKFTKVTESGFTMKSYTPNNGIVVLSYPDGELEVNTAADSATFDNNRYTVEKTGDNYVLSFSIVPSVLISLYAFGTFKASNCTVTSQDNSSLKVTLNDGTSLDVDVSSSGVMDFSQKSKLDYYYTDTRDENIEAKSFESIESDSEFQFLKQQWDTTVAVEHFWWINSTHILELTKDNLVLKKKMDALDDWAGDRWEVESTWNRFDYITADTYQYGVTNAKDSSTAYLWTISTSSDGVQFDFYDPLSMSHFSVDLPIVHRNLGEQLNPGNKQINSYSILLKQTVADASKISGTFLDDSIIVMGIHLNNNFDQWACVIDASTHSLIRIIQGYGYVGLNGCLTGGEIPSYCFDTDKGFSRTVEDKSVLNPDDDRSNSNISSLSEIYKIEEHIVGTEIQQWYVTKDKVTAIVSHLVWDSSAKRHNAELIPMNNNVETIYGSGSFGTRTLSDYMPRFKQLYEILPEVDDGAVSKLRGLLQGILIAAGDPVLCILNMKFNTCFYLQQSIGTYAYVHYNLRNPRISQDLFNGSTITDSDTLAGQVRGSDFDETLKDGLVKEEMPQSAEQQDEISFNVKTIPQSANSGSQPWSMLIGTMIQFFVSALDWTENELKVNAHQNAAAMLNTGRQYGQEFLNNVDAMSASDKILRSATPSCNTKVVSVNTFDMFYSTSNGQEVKAGPGFVNHNFVAKCIASSSTSCHLEANQVGVYTIISMVTMYQLMLENNIAHLTSTLLKEQADMYQGSQAPGAFGSTPGSLPYILIGMGFKFAWYAAEIVVAANDVLIEVIPKFLDMLGANQLRVSVTAAASNHIYDLEPKHAYGSKNESFAWPCFGCETPFTIHDEAVRATLKNNPWHLSIPIYSSDAAFGNALAELSDIDVPFVTKKQSKDQRIRFYDDIDYFIANCYGETKEVQLPADMAYVIGVDSFLPQEPFRNENIGEAFNNFTRAMMQDFIIDKSWQLGGIFNGTDDTPWVTVKDTKVIDVPPDNIFVSTEFCGVACPYAAIEVKRGISHKYIRPWAITPQALALNHTGLNMCYEEKAYHAFDGQGYRITSWLGKAGMGKAIATEYYCFIKNDRLKRSQILPPNKFIGDFTGEPSHCIIGNRDDHVWEQVSIPIRRIGLSNGPVGEFKLYQRYALPIFTEFVATLPAAVKTVSTYLLLVKEGITCPVTGLNANQSNYKLPVSVDFTIGKNKFRMTSEYLCSVNVENYIEQVEPLVPVLGLTYLGSTPYEAYLYSQATRQYYKFSGGTSLQVIDMIERFRDVSYGRYDFVNQEVIMPCLASFDRLDIHVRDDDDETDNIIIPRIKDGEFKGEVAPPIKTIFNTRSWFKTISLASGVTYQGPNRCIINRFVYSDYMGKSIRANMGLWKRVPREEYHPFREYKADYEQVDTEVGADVEVKGWTHNQFLLVTSALGTSSETDNLYEWEITFAWPIEMDYLYGEKQYATVNVTAETMTPGGKVFGRPTHIFLQKELFTRSNNYGYYSFRYQSKNGAGNRERLHIWSDQYIAISSLQCEVKEVTSKRTEQLTQQLDVWGLSEM